MHAGTLSVKNIFGTNIRQIVPLFQRPYVWRRDTQWMPFWDDIRAVADRLLEGHEVRPHFLGAIVVDLWPQPMGHVECRLLIDGQQRLTTIQLVLEAFADVCLELGSAPYHQALLQYTRNNDPLSTDQDEVFKVWPTNSDQDHFRRVMLAVSPEELRKEYQVGAHAAVGNLIADAYLFFHVEVRTWLLQDERLDARVDKLFHALTDFVRLVAIDLDSQDDAQLIFETLNARGTPLQPSDLVKNHLFHKADVEHHDILKLYHQYWKPFDADAAFWRVEQGRGHARRPVLDTYLQNYLTAKTEDEVRTAHLYSAFKEYVDGGGLSPVDVLADFKAYADIFRQFFQPHQHPRVNAFFRRLAAMDVVTAYPFLLELAARYQDQPHEFETILVDLESWLVRRLVCQLSTRGYGRVFVDFLKALKEDEGGAEHFRSSLLASDADFARWPDDAEFREAWLTAPLYRSLLTARIRMILEALEDRMRSEKAEAILFTESHPIEHLMPRGWRTYWPLDVAGEEYMPVAATRDRVVNTMGNLTLLTMKLNSSVSNGPWLTSMDGGPQGKRDQILKFSNLAINQHLHGVSAWNEKNIEARGNVLFDVARQVWPRPETAASATY